MTRHSSIVKAFSFCLLGVSLAACQAAPQRAEPYTDSSGATFYIESDRDSCTRACNADFDRCSETKASQTPVGRGDMTGILGGAADCRGTLKDCLSSCRKR